MALVLTFSEAAMQITLNPNTEKRLAEIAQQNSVPLPDFIEQVLSQYVMAWESDPLRWVQITQKQLGRVWPVEGFSSWNPPNAPQSG